MSAKVGTIYITFLSFHDYYNLATDLKPLMKGKPNLKIKKTKPIEFDESDDLSSMSSLADDSQGDKSANGSDDEDDEDDDNDFDVAQMTDREARIMLNDEVLFFSFFNLFQAVFDLKSFFLASPGYRSRCSFVVRQRQRHRNRH
jgi:hypothetical protein